MALTNNFNRKNRIPVYRRLALALFLMPFVFTALLLAGFFGPVPGTDELKNIRHHQASVVKSADGKILGSYYLQNRTNVKLEEVPPVFLDALLATEDIRFYDHSGIDIRAMARVLVKTVIMGMDAGGGSTITQQLAKNLYPRDYSWKAGMYADKLREMIIAYRLENIYTKQEILELYLNTVSFGEDTYGIEMSARRFFNLPVSGLGLKESALLVGLLKAPSYYNPRKYPDRAYLRSEVVLSQMEKYGMITPENAAEATAAPPEIDYVKITSDNGPAPYFREHLRTELETILDTLQGPEGETYDLYTDGLLIETTIDSRIQKAVEEAVKKQMTELQGLFEREIKTDTLFKSGSPLIERQIRQTARYKKMAQQGFSEEEISEAFQTPVRTTVFTHHGEADTTMAPLDSLLHTLSFLNSGFLVLDSMNGHVRAWSGGINHKYFKYDHVKSRRQTGSAIKPLVYAAAIESGIEPCDYRRNRLSLYNAYDEWTPQNINGDYGGRFSVQAALAHSVNTISVDLLMETGVKNAIELMRKAGIKSDIPSEPSLALGTAEVSLLELVGAYTSFLNGGYYIKPVYLSKIHDSSGRLLYSGDLNRELYLQEQDQAMSAETAAALVNMLETAVDEGTGSALRTRFGISHALAGKTGTTQNYTDGWFVGMTPDLVFGAWVGGWSTKLKFNTASGYASRTALPIAGYFLQNIGNDPGLNSQASEFYPEQVRHSFRMNCAEKKDDRLVDKVFDFLTGNDPDEPKVVDEKAEEEKTSFFGRIKKIFQKN